MDLDTETFLKKLKSNIHNNLPGEESHLPMSPTGRGRSSELLQHVEKYKLSSVAIILTGNEQQLKIVLTQRATYKGVHSGQISFPGGRSETFDQQPIDTAIRETQEETKIDLKQAEILGQLTNVFIPVSNFLVRPFVFFLDNIHDTDKNYEVKEIFEIETSDLLNEKSATMKYVSVGGKYQLKVPCFFIDGKIIWGATAIILNELKVLLQNVNS